MQKWEYLDIQLGAFPSGLNNVVTAPRFVNGQELKDWKKIALHDFINQLGMDGWEMTGTFNPTPSQADHLFFKRPKP